MTGQFSVNSRSSLSYSTQPAMTKKRPLPSPVTAKGQGTRPLSHLHVLFLYFLRRFLDHRVVPCKGSKWRELRRPVFHGHSQVRSRLRMRSLPVAPSSKSRALPGIPCALREGDTARQIVLLEREMSATTRFVVSGFFSRSRHSTEA